MKEQPWGATPRKFWNFNLKMVHFGGSLPYHFWRGSWGGGIWGTTPRKFWKYNLKMVHFGGSTIPIVGIRRGLWGAAPRKFWIFKHKMVHFGGSSILFWQIKRFATWSKYLLQLEQTFALICSKPIFRASASEQILSSAERKICSNATIGQPCRR